MDVECRRTEHYIFIWNVQGQNITVKIFFLSSSQELSQCLFENLSSRCRQISTTVYSACVTALRVWVLWRTLCYGPVQSGQGQLLPLASPRVSRAPGDCGGGDLPRHHQFLLLRKHRQGLRGEGNSLGICPSSSGTHRNISRSSRIDSGKNNWQNVNSKAKITITTPKPTWTL